MNIFISQPMRGLTDEEILKVRSNIKSAFREQYPDKAVNFYFTNLNTTPPFDANGSLYCLSKSIELLSKCDAIIFATGWRLARGCCIEWECALRYGLDVYIECGEVIKRYGD